MKWKHILKKRWEKSRKFVGRARKNNAMPFITNSNAHNILREIDYKNLNLEGSLYKTNIDFLINLK